MIKRLRFSVPEVSPLLARLASVVPPEFVVVVVVVELLLSLERSERTEEEDDEELVPELEDPDELGELYVFG